MDAHMYENTQSKQFTKFWIKPWYLYVALN